MPILGHVPSLLRRLLSERQGNIAIMFGLAVFPLIIAVGLAVDLSRGYAVRTRLNAALDDAGLALGSSPATMTTTDLNNRLRTYVMANFPSTAVGMAGTPTFVIGNNGATITVTGTATVPATLMQLIGVQNMTVSATSVISKGLEGLELAVVLDNTGSMLCGDSGCSDPIDHEQGLKTATHDSLLVPLFAQNADPTKLKISLVPYVTTVNVGPAFFEKYGDPGMKAYFKVGTGVNAGKYMELASTPLVPLPILDYNVLPIAFDSTQTENTPQWRGCIIEDTPLGEDVGTPAGFDVTEPAGGWDPTNATIPPWIAFYWHQNSKQPGSSGYNNWWTGATFTNNGGPNWTQPINYPHTPGQLNQIWQTTSAGPNNGCPTPMLRLKQMDATNQTTVLNAVNALQAWAAGGTMIHEGMIWGWRTLSPNPPFQDGVPYNQASVGQQWIKAVILETDGQNESIAGQNTGFSFQSDNKLGASQQIPHLDARLTQICKNMIAQDIEIWTVGFGSGISATSPLVTCAGGHRGKGKYIAATNSAALATAFAQIASELNTLRIAK